MTLCLQNHRVNIASSLLGGGGSGGVSRAVPIHPLIGSPPSTAEGFDSDLKLPRTLIPDSLDENVQ